MLLRRSIARILVLWLALGAIQAQHQAQAQQTGTKRSLYAADYQKKIAAVLDADNNAKWKLPIGDIHDAQPLADGRWLTQTSFGNVVELDADGKEVWRFEAGKPMRAARSKSTRFADYPTA